MADSDAGPLHPATPRKRQQARADGHVAKSADLTSAMVLLGGLLLILLFGERWWNATIEITQKWLANSAWSDLSRDGIQEITQDAMSLIVLILGPASIFLIGLPLAVHLLQTRFLLHIQSALPNLSRIQFTAWTNRTWTKESAVRLAFSFVKLLLLIAITIWFFAKRGSDFIALTAIPFQELPLSLGNLLLHVLAELTVAVLVLAVVDLFYQRRKYENQLMMTAEEIREESRNR